MEFEFDEEALRRELFSRYEEPVVSPYPEVPVDEGGLFSAASRSPGELSSSAQVRQVPLGRAEVPLPARVKNLERLNRKLEMKMDLLGKRMLEIEDGMREIVVRFGGGGVNV